MDRKSIFAATQAIWSSRTGRDRFEIKAFGVAIIFGSLALYFLMFPSALVKGNSSKGQPADCPRKVCSTAAHEVGHTMQSFGYVEFDWPNQPGGIPGFGPLRQSESAVFSDPVR
jgi:hypothetical protein